MSFFSVEKNKKTAFDELVVSALTPVVSLQFAYNINSELVESRGNNGATISASGGMAVISSGTNAQAAAHMLSKVPLKYDAGQGAVAIFSALFTTGLANSIQLAGIGEVGDGLFFGFNGAQFSILRRIEGNPEIQTLTIDSGASIVSGTITITLDGTPLTIELEQGDTTREVAVKIANADFSDTGLGWSAFVNNNTIIFKAWSDGSKSGTFNLVDTDVTGTSGTFSETVIGAATTNEWIAQTNWNVDTFDGSGGSKITLDPTKGNVYQIQYQWLGFGQMSFFIENPDTGKLTKVHDIKYANANIAPSLRNPTLPLHVMSKNTGNTSNMVIKTGSMGGFIEGTKILTAGVYHSVENNVTSISTTEVPILSIKNKIIYQGIINRVRMSVGFLSIAADASGNKPVIIRVRKNAVLTGTPNFTDHDANVSVAAEDKAATGITLVSNTSTAFVAIFGAVDSALVDFHTITGLINPGEIFTVTAQMVSGGGGDVTISIVWVDQF